MNPEFFVMLNNQKGDLIMPLVDENNYVMLFHTAEEADAAGNDNRMGAHFGFEVFRRGEGIDV